MSRQTPLAQKVRIQLVRIHIIVCEAKAGTVEVLCKNNTPYSTVVGNVILEPRNERQITFAPKILLCCHVISHMRRRYSALSCSPFWRGYGCIELHPLRGCGWLSCGHKTYGTNLGSCQWLIRVGSCIQYYVWPYIITNIEPLIGISLNNHRASIVFLPHSSECLGLG